MKYALACLVCFPLSCFAQFSDSFSDNDFTQNPTWSGSTSQFIINASQQLQLNNTAAATSFLSSSFTFDASKDYEWQVWFRLAFSPSSTNYARIYLLSNQTTLSGSLNGYYIQLGEANSNDAIELFRQTGSSSTSVCRGTNGTIISTNNTVRLKIIRRASGAWEVLADLSGGANFTTQATGTDATHTSGNTLGVLCTYTSSNATKFYFDDFYAGEIQTDKTPPSITSAQATSSQDLSVVFSEEVNATSASVLSNYTVSESIGNPSSAQLQADKKTVLLHFDKEFINGKLHTLSIQQVSDVAGNAMNESKSFRYFVAIDAIVSDIIFNELMPDPAPPVGLPTEEFIELFNRSKKAFNLSGWKLSDGTSTATLGEYYLLPNDYLLITSSSVSSAFTSYGAVLGVSTFPSLNNTDDTFTLTSPQGVVVDNVSYKIAWLQDDEKTAGGWSLERLNPEQPTNEPLNWQASVNVQGGTPGKQNSVFGFNPDKIKPMCDAVSVLSNTQIELTFSEPIQAVTSPSFSFSPALSIQTITTINSQKIALTFSSPMQNGRTYQMTIQKILDEAGNEIIATQKPLLYFVANPVRAFDIRISEIMTDPSPPVQLPETEYLEIFNRSANPIRLQNWTIDDASGASILPDKIILPAQYLVLTLSSRVSGFANAEVVGLSKLSLDNNGEWFRLRDDKGITIDSVFYEASWYKSESKKDGGWSLELIDADNVCQAMPNWTASDDASGGTPGRENSVKAVNQDLTPPQLQSVLVMNDSEIDIQFNEKLSASFSSFQFVLEPTLSINKMMWKDNQKTTLRVQFSSPIQPNKIYQLTAKNITDCSGNAIDENHDTATFLIPQKAAKQDVVLNEILFNPLSGGVDFVELYNRTEKYFSTKNWKLSNSKIGTSNVILFAEKIIPPFSFVLLTPDFSTLKSFYPAAVEKNLLTMNLPSMPDDEGALVLSSDAVTLDSLFYSDKQHHPLLKNSEGVSLERISTEVSAQEKSNWQSASEQAGWATPGYKNSAAQALSAQEEAVQVEPTSFSHDYTPNFCTIAYRFEQSGLFATIHIVDAQGRPVKTIAENTTLSTDGIFRWDGDTDRGDKALHGYYMVWFQINDVSGYSHTFRKRVIISGY